MILNKPYSTGDELFYIHHSLKHTSNGGKFSKLVSAWFKERFGFEDTLLTTSCTDALELSALLLDIKEGDEVIVPSYTFVSTANAFRLRGAKIVFCDSGNMNPNMDCGLLESLITPKTKAIVVVHYAGVACDMQEVLRVAKLHDLFIVEDAAQAIGAYYNNIPLGSIGDLGCFSFHETKNIQCGEGGMLVINNKKLLERAQIIYEKGTNRKQFIDGTIERYTSVDIGSSFGMSDVLAAFLYAQLKSFDKIQAKRLSQWNYYYHELKQKPNIPDYAQHNGHIFYNFTEGVKHYTPLEATPFYKKDLWRLNYSEGWYRNLKRLPLYYDLTTEEQTKIINDINSRAKC